MRGWDPRPLARRDPRAPTRAAVVRVGILFHHLLIRVSRTPLPCSTDDAAEDDEAAEEGSYCSSMDDGEEDEERTRERGAAALKVRRILAWCAQFAPASDRFGPAGAPADCNGATCPFLAQALVAVLGGGWLGRVEALAHLPICFPVPLPFHLRLFPCTNGRCANDRRRRRGQRLYAGGLRSSSPRPRVPPLPSRGDTRPALHPSSLPHPHPPLHRGRRTTAPAPSSSAGRPPAPHVMVSLRACGRFAYTR
ncbi:hypothetical protein FB451DRAFT_105399 [Mycena latifolia]|nr:hypothetical protein FB451DRAFT_105399 [Mycena latifolia]